MATGIADPINELIAEARRSGTNLTFNRNRRKLQWQGKPPSPELMAKIKANRAAIVTHLVRGQQQQGLLGTVAKAGRSYLGLPEGKAITGAQMAMAIPQLLMPEIAPEAEQTARLLGPKAMDFVERSPIKAYLANKLLRTGLAAGVGGAVGGKRGAGLAAGGELLYSPLEMAGPLARLTKRSSLARHTAADSGEVIADQFEQVLPNTANKIRAGIDRFKRGLVGNNWAHIMSRAPAEAEMKEAYDDGMSNIKRDLRNSILGKYQGEISKLQQSEPGAIADPLVIKAREARINTLKAAGKQEADAAVARFEHLKTNKIEAGNYAFKPSGEQMQGVTRAQRMADYRAATKQLHDFMNQMDMTYGSAMTPNLTKLDNAYDRFFDVREFARTKGITHPRSGGISRKVAQEAAMDPESIQLEKALGPDRFEKFQRSIGLNPETSSSMVPGSMPTRLRVNPMYGGIGAYAGIPKFPYDPVTNIPGVLNPRRWAGRAGAIGKAVMKGIAIPTALEKATKPDDKGVPY